MLQVISLLLENKPGALMRVTGLLTPARLQHREPHGRSYIECNDPGQVRRVGRLKCAQREPRRLRDVIAGPYSPASRSRDAAMPACNSSSRVRSFTATTSGGALATNPDDPSLRSMLRISASDFSIAARSAAFSRSTNAESTKAAEPLPTRIVETARAADVRRSEVLPLAQVFQAHPRSLSRSEARARSSSATCTSRSSRYGSFGIARKARTVSTKPSSRSSSAAAFASRGAGSKPGQASGR